MLLMIDNYDSFTFNLVQYLQMLGAEVKVVRNDAMSVAEIAALTHRSENTVKMWLCGRQVPDELTQSIIARRYNLNINGLFPKSEVQSNEI